MNQPDLFAGPHIQRGSSIVPRGANGDVVSGRLLAREGAKRAADHADLVHPSWQDRAFGYLLEYLAAYPSRCEITCESVRKHAEAKGFAAPPDKRAWGHIMLRGRRAGVLKRLGWTTADDPKVHCNPISLWGRA